MRRWKPEQDRKHCLTHYGNIAQLAGIRRCLYLDGKATGIEAAEVNTGGGLEFTVLPGRGMDIANCRYCGIPISYLSKTGLTAPSYHDRRKSEWLRSFFAGMLTTCGISNAGPSCVDRHPFSGEVTYGLHGDISNTSADQVGIREDWTSDGYCLHVSGRVSEGRFNGLHLSMRRTISARLGEKSFRITDEYQNEGSIPEPLMFFYHINVGYPILDEGAYMVSASRKVWAKTESSLAAIDSYQMCHGPAQDGKELQYFHEVMPDENGIATVALINDKLQLGFYLKYSPEQLPCLAQWKVGRQSEYVFAFEPGNCHPIGRAAQRNIGQLEMLEPMQSRFVEMELGILDGEEEILELKNVIKQNSCGGKGK